MVGCIQNPIFQNKILLIGGGRGNFTRKNFREFDGYIICEHNMDVQKRLNLFHFF